MPDDINLTDSLPSSQDLDAIAQEKRIAEETATLTRALDYVEDVSRQTSGKLATTVAGHAPAICLDACDK